MIHRVIVDAFFFPPHVMWKVQINLCILHHFDSETSHSFKSNSSQLICDKACLTLPRMFPFIFQNRFRNISVYKDEMHLIILQKEKYYDLQNYMECVFHSMSSAWKVQIIPILHHVKSEPSPSTCLRQHPLPLASRDSPPFCKSCDT